MIPGTVAVMPPGALGVSFFFHLTSGLQHRDGKVFLLGLDGSRSVDALLASDLQIAAEGKQWNIPFRDVMFRTLGDAWESDVLPEVLIVCPNPDQLLPVLSTVVELIERIYAAGLDAFENLKLPAIVLSSNGIYFQRVRQMFIEKLEESTLLGRLPDLWPEMMPKIVGHLLRGVTVQTGLRTGSGQGTVYYPGPTGNSILTGGSEDVRMRCFELLTGLGTDLELAPGASPTRLEFEKAILNLTANLLGLIYAFGDDGNFTPLTIADTLTPDRIAAARQLTYRICEVGQAVRAFAPTDDFELIFNLNVARSLHVGAHIPSSLQAARLQVETGTLEVKFPPTETWLIDPLIHYARSANLTHAVEYFEGLRTRLLKKLEVAVRRQEEQAVESG